MFTDKLLILIFIFSRDGSTVRWDELDNYDKDRPQKSLRNLWEV